MRKVENKQNEFNFRKDMELNPIELVTVVSVNFTRLLEEMGLDPNTATGEQFFQRYQEICKNADEFIEEAKQAASKNDRNDSAPKGSKKPTKEVNAKNSAPKKSASKKPVQENRGI